MTKDTMIGVDLAQNVFQLHAASMIGQPKFRKKLSRQSFSKFMAEQPPAVVVMQACGSAHFWAREMIRLGHEVKLIATQYVKPFVKRKKNDAANAEAIVIAAQWPEMRFIEPKSADQQGKEFFVSCARTASSSAHWNWLTRSGLASMYMAMLFRRDFIRSSGLQRSLMRRMSTCPIWYARNARNFWTRLASKPSVSMPEPGRSRRSRLRLTQRGDYRQSQVLDH